MKRFETTILVAALGVALAPSAQAQVSANIGAVSNYVWRGMTQTDDGPAVQGGIDYAHESGLFLGTWASNVDFRTPDPDVEMDLYAGYAGSVGDFSYKATLIYYWYPGDNVTADFSELTLSGTYKMLTVGVAYTLTGQDDKIPDGDEMPYDSGDLYVYGSIAVPLGNDFSLTGTVGYYNFDDVADTSFTHGVIGVSKSAGDFGTFSLNVSKAWLSNDDTAALALVDNDDEPKVFVSWIKTF